MKLQYFTVDAFTSEPFTGNPAAVCPLEEDISDSLKQSIAKEMNISETCFITKVQNNHSAVCLCVWLNRSCFEQSWFDIFKEMKCSLLVVNSILPENFADVFDSVSVKILHSRNLTPTLRLEKYLVWDGSHQLTKFPCVVMLLWLLQLFFSE